MEALSTTSARRAALWLFLAMAAFRLGAPFIRVPMSWAYFAEAFVLSPIFICLNVLLIAGLARANLGTKLMLWIPMASGLIFFSVAQRQYADLVALNSYREKANEYQFVSDWTSISANLTLGAASAVPGYVAELPAMALVASLPPPPEPPRTSELTKLGLDLGGKLSLFLLLFAIGYWICRGLVRELNLLVPIAPVIAVADIISVIWPHGPTREALRKAPELVTLVSQTVPHVATANAPTRIGEPFALIGPGDIIFLSLFMVAFQRYGLPMRRTVFALCVTLVFYLELVLGAGSATIFGYKLDALPALVPMAIVILLVNRRQFVLSAQEKLMAMAATIAACGFMAAAFYMFR